MSCRIYSGVYKGVVFTGFDCQHTSEDPHADFLLSQLPTQEQQEADREWDENICTECGCGFYDDGNIFDCPECHTALFL